MKSCERVGYLRLALVSSRLIVFLSEINYVQGGMEERGEAEGASEARTGRITSENKDGVHAHARVLLCVDNNQRSRTDLSLLFLLFLLLRPFAGLPYRVYTFFYHRASGNLDRIGESYWPPFRSRLPPREFISVPSQFQLHVSLDRK